MKGIVRSTSQSFTQDTLSNGRNTITIKTPYQQQHVFEVQIFFGLGSVYSFYGKGSNVEFASAKIGALDTLKFYVDPEYKRSDEWVFEYNQIDMAIVPTILAIFSYIDKG